MEIQFNSQQMKVKKTWWTPHSATTMMMNSMQLKEKKLLDQVKDLR
jgi:hypothetical protein